MKMAFEHRRIFLVKSLGISLPFRHTLVKWRVESTLYNILTTLTRWGDIATRGKTQPSEHPY